MTCSECQECGKPIVDCSCQECNPCKQKERECCVPNIVADGDCITVETDSEGVIHLSTRCNPIIKSSDGSVNVSLDESGDVDVWDLEVIDNDHLVGACDADKNPGTLDQKLVGVNGITITPICSDNGKIQIGFDHSTIECDDKKVAVAEGCTPDYLGDLIQVQSSRLEKSVSNCRVIIKDKEEPAYYAKLVLGANHIVTVPAGTVGWWEPYVGALASVQWKPARQSGGNLDVRNSLLKGLKFNGGTALAPGKGWIEITKKGLYQVGFTGSAEFSYGVHAFRVQLYRVPASNRDAYNTIVESRYSGPLGYEPWQAVIQGAGDIKLDSYVTDIALKSDDTVRDVYKSSYEKRIDYPLIGEKTEVEGQAGTGYSASMGAILDRVTVTGNTIVECDVGDYLFIGIKVSTSITHSGDIMAKIPAQFLTGHFALLGADVESGDNGPEAGFSYYANLVHPILN